MPRAGMVEKKGGNNQEVQRADNETKTTRVCVCVCVPGGELVTMMRNQYRHSRDNFEYDISRTRPWGQLHANIKKER